MIETPQIKITVMTMGLPERVYEYTDKAEAKATYLRLSDSLCCYPAVSVDGKQLNTAKARKFFGMKKLIGNNQWRESNA
jgi:hypothetical protein